MRKLFLLAVLLVATVPLFNLSAQSERPLYFEPAREPTIPHNVPGQYTDPGAVLFHDGTFYMFRNDFNGWPAAVDIYLDTSEDGLTWTAVGDEPLLRTADAPFDVTAVLASSAVVMDDGTWVLYLYTFPDATFGAGGSIMRATADAPDGVWTFETEPVLSPGAEGIWDSVRVSAPSVIETDDGYTMFYEGIGAGVRANTAIGFATSTDGITWAKYDDPATTDAVFGESDPVFTNEDVPWEADAAHQPRVVLTPDGIVMMYRTFVGQQQEQIIGIAISDDGLNWRAASDEPPLRALDRAVLSQIWYTAFAYADGAYYGYFEIGRGMTTNIHAARLEGSFLP